MRKIVFLFSIIATLFLSGCDQKIPSENLNNDDINTIEAFILDNLPEFAVTDILLPVTHPELGGEISWRSLDESAILDDGTFVLLEGFRDVLLEYNITLNGKELAGFYAVGLNAVSFDDIADEFTNQFNYIIARSYEVKTSFMDNRFIVEWSSSNEQYFTNSGEYNAPEFREELTINFTVKYKDITRNYSYNAEILERPVVDKGREIKNWITEDYLPHKILSDSLDLPTEFVKMRNGVKSWVAKINWFPTNRGVITTSGVINQFGFDRYVNLLGEIVIGDNKTYIDFDLIIPGKTYSTDEEKINDFLDAIAVEELERLTFDGYANITQTYNFLSFYTKVDYMEETPKQIIDIRNTSASVVTARPGTKLSGNGVEFITIHDTANTGASQGAQMHANLQSNGYTASWHYQTDDQGAIQSIPLDEVAWHAGDGSTTFGLLDTGIKAGLPYPEIIVGDDGYYYLNNQKSEIKAPKIASIAASGIYTEIGLNGNYYMNKSYFNPDYGVIANQGGNRNSIGIESCVNYGSDYGTTLRVTSKLVSELLIEFDLNIDRIMQHNNFSGKHCPRTLINTNYWYGFLDMVSLEKYAREQLSDYDFTWVPMSESLSVDGKIDINSSPEDILKYSVTVTKISDGTTVMTKEFTTTLK